MTYDEIRAAIAGLDRDRQASLLSELQEILGRYPVMTLSVAEFVEAINEGRWVDEGLEPGSVTIEEAKSQLERTARNSEYPDGELEDWYELTVENIVAERGDTASEQSPWEDD
jgi:hypothetical protein